ncbi:hypothetical protein LUZ60_002131 [Juncus effusus]|nr:hypothetical protein LUZ60_002131 [Juncus effusus]
MDGAGSWDALEWTKIDTKRTPEHGLEEFLFEAEDVIVHQAGVVLLNNAKEAGTLAVTNYRLLFVSQTSKRIVELGTIPLATIEKFTDDVKLPSISRNSEKRELLQVFGKDMRIAIFAFLPKTMQRSAVVEALKRFTKPTQLWDLYTFQCGPSRFKNSNPKLRLLKEYYRFFGKRFSHVPSDLGDDESYLVSNNRWRITNINSNYALCGTYPSKLIVPKNISDEELMQAASFRASKRLPVISWCDTGSGAVLARSSQPRVGLMSYRNHSDEKLVAALCPTSTDSNKPTRKLYIVDARPIANAFGNGVKGGGSESSSNYFKSEVVFLGIDNIHAMRESLFRLREYVDTHGTTSSDGTLSFLRNGGSTWGGGNFSSMSGSATTLGDTGWLIHVQNVLSGAAWIAARIFHENSSVLVHCSDGWDRTTQLVSLASLLLDPYYRTFKGFQALVEKDWLAFGHPFADRMGIPTASEMTSTSSTELLVRQSSVGSLSSSPIRTQSGSNLPPARPGSTTHSQASENFSPILLQWVDCVSQLLRLYPCAFEFSSKFLVDFLDAVLSCRFGNFLCNCERERQQSNISESMACIWMYLQDLRSTAGGAHEHFNLFYDPSRHTKPILPSAAALAPTIWPQFHLRWACPAESHSMELESMWRSMNNNYNEMLKAKELAESKARDLKSKTDSLLAELQASQQSARSAKASLTHTQRENLAIKRAIQSLGCKVDFSPSSRPSSNLSTSTVSDANDDISVSISAIEDAGAMAGGNPLTRICESVCPFRTNEGCKWPDEQCAQLGSQFVGLKADFDAFDRLSIYDRYFESN